MKFIIKNIEIIIVLIILFLIFITLVIFYENKIDNLEKQNKKLSETNNLVLIEWKK